MLLVLCVSGCIAPPRAVREQSPEACDACPEDTEFLDFVLVLDAIDPTLVKAHELRALRPRIGPDL